MIRILRWILIVGLPLSGLIGAAPAPVSIAGMVFHGEQFAVGTTPTKNSIQLNADGTYTYILNATGVEIGGGSPPFYLVTPPANGTFTYVVNADSSADLGLQNSAGGVYYAHLVFSSSTAGMVVSEESAPFYLTAVGQFTNSPVGNCSLLGSVTQGHPFTVGFIVPGTDPRDFLIRVIGPGLAQFGVSNPWAVPSFQVYQGSNALSTDWVYEGWSSTPTGRGSPVSAFDHIFSIVGAFPLAVGSADSVAVVRLSPGAYTVVATTATAGDPGGNALIELYVMP